MVGITRHACRWSELTLAGVSLNLVVLISAPILRPDLDLLDKSLSYYAIGPWGTLQAAAFVALGVASATLAFALLGLRLSAFWIRSSAVLLVISGLASLGLVIYPMGAPGPETVLGDAHQTAGTIGGVAQLAAALASALAIRSDPRWGVLLPPTLLAFSIALLAALCTQAAIWWPQLGIPMGATMRLLVVPLVLLWGLVALRLRRRCSHLVRRSSAAT